MLGISGGKLKGVRSLSYRLGSWVLHWSFRSHDGSRIFRDKCGTEGTKGTYDQRFRHCKKIPEWPRISAQNVLFFFW
jgi:hypothetical protein